MKDMPEKLEEEVEIIPLSPLRRLEKRIERLESSTKFDTKEFYKELVSIIRMNQQLVNDVVTANDALRIELSKLPGRLENLASKLEELITFIKASATEEVVESHIPSLEPLSKKLDQLIEINKKIVENNQSLLSILEDLESKLRRPVIPPIRRKPLMPRKQL